MGITTKAHIPLVSETKFNVSQVAAIASGTAAYGTITNAGNGDWIKGDAMPKGRKILAVINTATVAGTPTSLKVCLLKGDDANGTNGAEVTGSATEIASPAGDSAYTAEIDLAGVDDMTKYYSLGLAVKGATSSDTLIADCVGLVLDKTYL